MVGPPDPILRPQGDTALLVEFPGTFGPALTRRILAFDAALTAQRPVGLIETVPAYRTVTLHLDPSCVDLEALCAIVEHLAALPVADRILGRLWEVPVVYGGAFGCDLEHVSAHADLTPAACVDLHAATTYQVAMVGYLPGFSYLSGLDPRLEIPRRTDPRAKIPASSISIGGQQTAIGSLEGPSGWHLIGRTPVRPYDPSRDPQFLFAPGDRIRFRPILPSDWQDLDAAAAQGAQVARLLAE